MTRFDMKKKALLKSEKYWKLSKAISHKLGFHNDGEPKTSYRRLNKLLRLYEVYESKSGYYFIQSLNKPCLSMIKAWRQVGCRNSRFKNINTILRNEPDISVVDKDMEEAVLLYFREMERRLNN